MRPSDVGIQVDHLGLEPQSWTHTEFTNVIEQRCQSVGPDALVHLPVAEAGSIVAAVSEPSVVEHESFDAYVRGDVGDPAESGEIVIEVDPFPHVQHHRSRRGGMCGSGSHPSVQRLRRTIQPCIGIHEVHPRCRVGVAVLEYHLAGCQQLSATQHS